MGPLSHSDAEGTRFTRWRAAAVSAALVLAAAGASAISSRFIAQHFPLRPTPRDLLFELLPHLHIAQYTADLALLLMLVLTLVWAARSEPTIPAVVSVFALMYLLRAGAMALTPLASAHGNGARFGIVPLVQNGMWPSGHAGAALLCVLFAEKMPRVSRLVMSLLAVTVWVSLIVGHAHYSIDVAGGMLLAYFVYREWFEGSALRPLRRLNSPLYSPRTRASSKNPCR